MGKKRDKAGTPLEDGLLMALRALDNQIAREMQRTPVERQEHGVQKWEPYNKRVELLVAQILNWMGEELVDLDSVLVLAQAMSKSLHFIASDLGEEGLGDLRSSYCRAAFEAIENDVRRGMEAVRAERNLV